MKTQILQLEPHDDVISTRDKMGWSQTSRILLVWPSRGRVLVRRLDLELLLRHNRSLGGQLALVTRDSEVRFHAKQLGIDVFNSVRQAQDTRWRRPYRHKIVSRRRVEQVPQELPSAPTRSENGAGLSAMARLGLFGLGVLALLSIAAVLLPSAEVAITPETRRQEITLSVEASPSVDRVNLSGLIPVRHVSVVLEGRDSLTPTGEIQVPEHRATGQVEFTNLTDDEISVPAGTVVSTPGASIRFTTDHEGQVPAGSGETLSLPVTAMAPGSVANLPADRIIGIEGPLGLSLVVSNPAPTQGGSDRSSPAPTPLDRSRLSNRLLSTLRDGAEIEIHNLLKPDDLLLGLAPAPSRILEETYNPPDDQPTSELILALRVEFQAQIVSGEDLEELARSALDANLAPGYSPQSGTLEIEHRTSPRMEDSGSAHWVLKAHRLIVAKLVESQALAATIGLSPAQAAERLQQNLPLGGPAEISLVPRWWPRLPFLPFRIHVTERR
ncbi:MAG TPA: baseplate J/gp47 family protein [Anaerolineales bacterium]|nr:baseplate J/gp47 family protein [Anaerolineales bacterium]